MIEPKQAAVRPRVVIRNQRGVVLLEDLVAEMAESGLVRVVELYGSPGSGTTTALKHLAFVFGSESGFRFIDRVRPANFFLQNRASGGILFLSPTRRANAVTIRCELAGWGRDEWIEYLLFIHKDKCGSVMRRILNDAQISELNGNPGILSQTLNELATDERCPDVKSALARIIDRTFPDAQTRRSIATWAIDSLVKHGLTAPSAAIADLSCEQSRTAHNPAVQLRLATEALWHDLTHDNWLDSFAKAWHPKLVSAVAAHVAESKPIQDKLQSWINSANFLNVHPRAVSLLHAAGVPWESPANPKQHVNLSGAILDEADCTQKRLSHCMMTHASFNHAILTGVSLQDSSARMAYFNNADLRQTDLTEFDATSAHFVDANLAGTKGNGVRFKFADLTGADLTDVHFHCCDLRDANLTRTNLCRSKLKTCDFDGACIEEADFRDANLSEANLAKSDLTMAHFEGANFHRAIMFECNLEGMLLPDTDFTFACLANAVMSGSIMPRSSFADAILRFAKLADVEWESVDLRNADLTGVTFHMGSSRSGLVSSDIPMHGSRTGFYTDEFNEQDFKAPEQIRSANLRGADLRGAIIKDVDFYLVDLRDAIYDPSQADQLRNSGAILVSRASG